MKKKKKELNVSPTNTTPPPPPPPHFTHNPSRLTVSLIPVVPPGWRREGVPSAGPVALKHRTQSQNWFFSGVTADQARRFILKYELSRFKGIISDFLFLFRTFLCGFSSNVTFCLSEHFLSFHHRLTGPKSLFTADQSEDTLHADFTNVHFHVFH